MHKTAFGDSVHRLKIHCIAFGLQTIELNEMFVGANCTEGTVNEMQ
jgi:hypothetical protein